MCFHTQYINWLPNLQIEVVQVNTFACCVYKPISRQDVNLQNFCFYLLLVRFDSMSDYGIEISPGSKVVIFQGSVKKAPQLNKRGRKVSDLYKYIYLCI